MSNHNKNTLSTIVYFIEQIKKSTVHESVRSFSNLNRKLKLFIMNDNRTREKFVKKNNSIYYLFMHRCRRASVCSIERTRL